MSSCRISSCRLCTTGAPTTPGEVPAAGLPVVVDGDHELLVVGHRDAAVREPGDAAADGLRQVDAVGQRLVEPAHDVVVVVRGCRSGAVGVTALVRSAAA